MLQHASTDFERDGSCMIWRLQPSPYRSLCFVACSLKIGGGTCNDQNAATGERGCQTSTATAAKLMQRSAISGFDSSGVS